MKITASAERRIGAPADRVYAYIADFREHHANFLPPQFSDFEVEEGGIGAGTVHRFTLTLGGRASTARAHVAEPEPGRVLTETEESRGLVTAFTVDPLPDGSSRVRIDTSWSASGIRGIVERALAPRMLRRLYAEELTLLDRYARERSKSTPRVMRANRGVVVA